MALYGLAHTGDNDFAVGWRVTPFTSQLLLCTCKGFLWEKIEVEVLGLDVFPVFGKPVNGKNILFLVALSRLSSLSLRGHVVLAFGLKGLHTPLPAQTLSAV